MSFWQSTDTNAGAPFGANDVPRRGRLGRKFVVHVIVLNALLSIFASSIQLYASYQRDRTQVLGTMAIIDNSFSSGFEEALWEYNFPLVEALLDGVISKPDVRYLSLSTNQGRTWTLGEKQADRAFEEALEFTYTNNLGEIVSLGQLDVQLTFAHIRSRAWSQLWTLLLSNFAKTICASALLLLLFDRDIGRHLATIAARVSHPSWLETAQGIDLGRNPKDGGDDLDHIVAEINGAKRRSTEALEALKKEVRTRRQVETDLRHRTEALENANREQAQFTYAISHDLKSPANTITMLLQELELVQAGSLSAEGQEILGDARMTVQRMTQLVEDILGYARTIEEGMQIDTVDLNAVVHEILEDLRGDISNAGAEIVANALPVIEGNRAQLRMLMQNLIANAVKFRAPDRPPRVELACHPATGPRWVKITVTDNGIGIAPQYHDKVFELFQRLHSYGEYDGSGMGLTLCKRVVTNHSGHIRIASRAGHGTTIEINLPRENHGT